MSIFVIIISAIIGYLLTGFLHAVTVEYLMRKKGVKPLEGHEFFVIFFAVVVCWPLALLSLFFDI